MRSCKFSDLENEVDLILSRADIFETPKDIDDFSIFVPFIDQTSVLGGVLVLIVDVERLKKCPAMVKVGLSRFLYLCRNP